MFKHINFQKYNLIYIIMNRLIKKLFQIEELLIIFNTGISFMKKKYYFNNKNNIQIFNKQNKQNLYI